MPVSKDHKIYETKKQRQLIRYFRDRDLIPVDEIHKNVCSKADVLKFRVRRLQKHTMLRIKDLRTGEEFYQLKKLDN